MKYRNKRTGEVVRAIKGVILWAITSKSGYTIHLSNKDFQEQFEPVEQMMKEEQIQKFVEMIKVDQLEIQKVAIENKDKLSVRELANNIYKHSR